MAQEFLNCLLLTTFRKISLSRINILGTIHTQHHDTVRIDVFISERSFWQRVPVEEFIGEVLIEVTLQRGFFQLD